MDSALVSSVSALPATVGGAQLDVASGAEAALSLVDPFLVEALQNPRHRLTILRMELDVQRFLQNPGLQQFEFPHLPTSYLRLAAHRVAQHYGLQTMVQDNLVDGQGMRILVRKNPESKYPAICLSNIPVKQSENDELEQVKVVLKQRPSRANDTGDLGSKRSPVRTVEERMEEYDRARARIFNSPSSSELEETCSRIPSDGHGSNSNVDNGNLNSVVDTEKNIIKETGSSSRVAILRDREKDCTDPDYDRSYERYVKNIPKHQSFNFSPYMPKLHRPFLQYDSVFPRLTQLHVSQAPPNYRSAALSPFSAVGLSQASRDPVYFQWPTHSLMYAHSYDQLRHAVFQAPFYQQPLSFDYSHNL